MSIRTYKAFIDIKDRQHDAHKMVTFKVRRKRRPWWQWLF